MHVSRCHTARFVVLVSLLGAACGDDSSPADVGASDVATPDGGPSDAGADLVTSDASIDGGAPDASVADSGPTPEPSGVGFGEGGACEELFAAANDVFDDAGELVDCAGVTGGDVVARSLMNVNSLTIDNDGVELEPCIAVRCDSTYAYIASNALPHYDFVRTGRNALSENEFLTRIPLVTTPISEDAEAESWNSINGCVDAYDDYVGGGAGTAQEPGTYCSQGRRVTGLLFDEVDDVRRVVDRVSCFGGTGIAINGVPLFGPNEALRPDAYGNPGYNYPNDTMDTYGAGPSLDFCGAHAGASMHHHAFNDACFERDGSSEPALSYADASADWDIAASLEAECDRPSPILGWAIDGYPIRGGCVCAARSADGECTDVRRARSGWTYEGLSEWGDSPQEPTALGVEGMACDADAECCAGGGDCDFSCSVTVVDDGSGGTEVAKRCTLVEYSWCIHEYTARQSTPVGQAHINLDRCNGFDGPDGYAYYTTMSFPYSFACHRGLPNGDAPTRVE